MAFRKIKLFYSKQRENNSYICEACSERGSSWQLAATLAADWTAITVAIKFAQVIQKTQSRVAPCTGKRGLALDWDADWSVKRVTQRKSSVR